MHEAPASGQDTIMNLNDADIAMMRKVQLRLLDEFAALCEKHGFRYWLTCGTLIGAVRHKGFIPWDDDIDIAMPAKDFEAFLEIAQSELPPDIFLQTMKTDPGYSYHYAKLRDCNSCIIEMHELDKPAHHTGIYIDIFPKVPCPRLPHWLLTPLGRHILRSSVYICEMRKAGRTSPLRLALHRIKYVLCKALWLLFRHPEGSYISSMPEDIVPGIFLRIKDTFPLGKVEFEGKAYSAPRNIDAWLRIEYGDYMQMPPPEKRTRPHIKKLEFGVPQPRPGGAK